jgi:AcrR family transcriptional regulator
MFSDRGFANTRMADVAAELDMQAGSLYYYVDSKEGLLAAVVEERVGVAVDMLEEILGRNAGVVDKIRAGIEGHLVVFDEHADLYRIFLSERLHHIAPEVAGTVDKLGRHYEQLWVDLVTDGIVTGELRSDLDAWLTMKAIVGLGNSTLFWFEPDGRLTPEAVAERFTAVILDGIRP